MEKEAYTEPALASSAVEVLAQYPAWPWWRTWVTTAFFLACVVIFVGINLQEKIESGDDLYGFGYVPGTWIWGGEWWGTFTSVFVHYDLLHLVPNLYWLWVLGRSMEAALGSVRFLVFFAVAAMLTSTVTLAMSDDTGIGISGVLFALFGFMWRARGSYARFQPVMVRDTVLTFIVWVVVCLVLDEADLLETENSAHVSGLLLGMAVAEGLVVRRPRIILVPALTVGVVLALVPLWWAPWSLSWQVAMAANATNDGRLEEGLSRLNHVLERDPQNAWAYQERGWVYEQMEEFDLAEQDFAKAAELEQAAQAETEKLAEAE
ncbi:GlpG protein [Roseimicrobium gellanilyticum]|uniref:GlpG protein n=1 Tax=Roseimicrobium gellanilyticum TaxID=748857 RepID=A0A366HEV1_9BACT|nr:rhomboid family intramembrane serine protease [Roseimicrobium gellanilyticum]RBP40449.1 GlpG protein [Roseimicrobium gellanilyticum]